MSEGVTAAEVRVLLEGTTPGPWMIRREEATEYYGDWWNAAEDIPLTRAVGWAGIAEAIRAVALAADAAAEVSYG